ncbi:MAG: hypothetical protein E7199_09135 [Schwartzia succinivorans]|nr:hypothetical protein [Schwartzia succinivorans]
MQKSIARSLTKLQKLSKIRGESIEDIVQEAIYNDDQRLIAAAIEWCHEFYGKPATAEAYVSQDGIEMFGRLSGVLDRLSGLYWHTFVPPDDIFAEQIYLPEFETRKLRPITFNLYNKMMSKLTS